MESPRIHGGAEENSSCESGWTMYIEDTFQSHVVVYDDDDDDDDNDQSNERVPGDDDDDNDEDGDDGDEESDDSMASDASSWPSTQHLKNTKKHAVKQVQETEKIACEMFSDKGDESELNAKTRNTAASHVQSRGKVSKTK